ncbi:MAG: hypothetical protein WCD38_11700 [Candidatus Tumulicola sp.]
MTTAAPPPIPAASSPAIDRAKAACIAYLPTIEKTTPGDGGALRVPYAGTYVRVTCYHRADGELVVRVTHPHRTRHYHIVESETTP